MRKRSRAALLLSMVALAGCATKLDFDGASSGNQEAPRDGGLDSGRMESDAGAREAAVMAEPDAAVATPDAGPSPLSDQSPATFSCERVSAARTFCDDFENDTLLQRWGDISVTRSPEVAGTIAHDSTAPRAGMSSLLVVLNEGVTPSEQEGTHVGVGKDLPDFTGPSRVTIDFDVRVAQVDSRPEHAVLLFRYILGRDDIGYTWHTLMLDSDVEDNGLSAALVEWDADGLGDKPVDENTELPPIVPFWQPTARALGLYNWAHVKYVLEGVGVANGAVNLTLSIDDVVLFTGVPHHVVRGGRGRLELGIPDINYPDYPDGEKTETWRVHYDNVLVRTELLDAPP